MFWAILSVLFFLWLLGFSLRIGGNVVHTLLLIVLIALLVRFIP